MVGVTVGLEEPSAVLELRRELLRPGRPVEESVYPTDADPLTGHAVARNDAGDVVGIATIALDPGPPVILTSTDPSRHWRLRGMATSDAVRGTGVGRRVLDLAVDHARSNGAELLWCNARLPAVGFYERAGWRTVGEQFELPNIGPHYVMLCEAF